MSFPDWKLLMRRVSLFGAAAFLAVSFVSAQSRENQGDASSFSLSTESRSQQTMASLDRDGSSSALPAVPAPVSAASQETATYSGWKGSDIVHRLTFEASGGVNAPAGDKTYITWGAQFTVGGGVNFSRHVALFAEYQFMDDKVPGAIIAEAGAQGGHDHIWSLTLDPVVSLFPKSNNDIYITGGGGFYRKVTSFTDVVASQYCDFYYCGVGYTPQVVGHFSSNQGGFNVGGGFQHRLGGMYGDSRMRVFAEVRYVYIASPAVITQPNGLGTTSVPAGTTVLPVNFGVRW